MTSAPQIDDGVIGRQAAGFTLLQRQNPNPEQGTQNI
jgi:hypothetical protein